MEEGQHAQNAVVLAVVARIDRVDLARIGRQVLVAQHRALGRAGGAAGILEQRDVALRIDRHLGVGAVIGDQLRKARDPRIVRERAGFLALEQPEQQRLDRREPSGDRSHHQSLQARLVEHLERGRQQGGGRQREQDRRAAVLDLMRQLVDGVERREIDHGRPGRHRAIIGSDIMRHVGQEQPDPVPLADAQRLQALGDARNAPGDLVIAVFAAHEIEQRRRSLALSRCEEHLRKR